MSSPEKATPTLHTDHRPWGYRWLLLRRVTQATILAAFLLGPLAGIWILDGNLASSSLFGHIPLTDPFVFLQSLAAGFRPGVTALVGCLILIGFYLLVGGRTFCSWVCPINPITDAAAWLRRRLGIKGGLSLKRDFRLWALLACLASAWVTGALAWEYVNPVTSLMRGLLFGMSSTGILIAAIFIFDIFVAQRGWCGHLCPMGACYGILGQAPIVRVSADKRGACTDCMDCFAVCPEPHVIRPALKTKGTPLIVSADCTNCGRCIDVCADDVFQFTNRFNTRVNIEIADQPTKDLKMSSEADH